MTKTWGPSTWYLFHTLAEKVNDETFNDIKLNLIHIIKLICNNLPCPDCSMHASAKMDALNINMIKSKNDLKQFLLFFHNEVNSRLGKPLFKPNDLETKYKLAKTQQIIQYFISIWSKRSHNPRLMTEDLHKSRAVSEFNKWWSSNYHHFRP